MHLRVQRFDSLDSTSEEAFRQLAAGTAGHGATFVAERQTKGRGRRGQRWTTTPGESIALSLIVEPSVAGRTTPLHPALLTMSAGLAVLDVARACGVTSARLKWPNDLLSEGAKLAGILVESRSLPGQPAPYVVGVGLNVSQTSFPEELRLERPVTSLRLCGSETDLAHALEQLQAALAIRLETALSPQDPQPIETEFLAGLGLARGDTIEIGFHGDQPPRRGTLEDFSLNSGITLRDPNLSTPIEHVASLTKLSSAIG